MNKETRLIYNPFLLKLLHSKAYYMDKLLCLYLPRLGDTHGFITHNYNVPLLLRDVTDMVTIGEKEAFGVDLYLVNFEFVAYRLYREYVSVDKASEDCVLFQCEAILRQLVDIGKKRALMSRLCEQYIRRVYLDGQETERARLFFNLKHSIEQGFMRGVMLQDDIVLYDRAAIVGLLYLYFMNEFISEATRDEHIERLSRDPVEHVSSRAYVMGETSTMSLDEAWGDTGGDILFLREAYDKLRVTLEDYVCGWCIKVKYTGDSSRSESDEERLIRRHNEQYDRYYTIQSMSLPSLYTKYPASKFRHFLFGDDDNETANPLVFLTPEKKGAKFYEAIVHEMLFHMRLEAHHTECIRGACNTCHYVYLDYMVSEFNKQCRRYRYHKERRGDDDDEAMIDRAVFDRYLEYTIIPVVTPFRGLIFRVLYNMALMLYHTPLIIVDENDRAGRDTNLFAMVDIDALVASVAERNDFFLDLEARMQRLVSACRQCEIVRPMMQERECVRRFALDMLILANLVDNVDCQYVKSEKYERSLSVDVLPGQYKIHTQMMRYLRLLYIYYTRNMCSLLKMTTQ